MNTFTAFEVTDPQATSGPDFEALTAFVEISRFEALDTTGHEDFVTPVQAWAISLKAQEYGFKRMVLAKSGEEFVGAGFFRAPKKDNLSVAFIEAVALDNNADVLAFLHAHLEGLAKEHNRTVLNGWNLQQPVDASHPEYLAAPTGVGGIDRSNPVSAAYLAAGWSLEQSERYSVLELPVAPERLQPLVEQATAKASSEYELVQWIDHTPDQFVAGHCVLQQAMSTDVPHGELVVEETNYDADRLRSYEKTIADMDRHYLAIAAVHKETGDLAGFTRVEWSQEKPSAVMQEETLVRKDHRGHALGLWLKSYLVEEILRVNPSAQRIHTWNAGENEHMLAINIALGFELRGVEGAWQKKLS